jgi:hypothetical protein
MKRFASVLALAVTFALLAACKSADDAPSSSHTRLRLKKNCMFLVDQAECLEVDRGHATPDGKTGPLWKFQ